MSKGIYSSLTVAGEVELNAELCRRGIPYTIGDLFHDGALCAECGAQLLELFRRPLPFNVRTALAQAVFARKLKPAQRREAFGILLELIKENPEKYNSLSMLVWNELPDNVDSTKVHELGQMALDGKYGTIAFGLSDGFKEDPKHHRRRLSAACRPRPADCLRRAEPIGPTARSGNAPIVRPGARHARCAPRGRYPGDPREAETTGITES